MCGGGNFTVKKPEKHNRNQAIKVNINIINHIDNTYPSYDAVKVEFNLCSHLLQNS